MSGGTPITLGMVSLEPDKRQGCNIERINWMKEWMNVSFAYVYIKHARKHADYLKNFFEKIFGLQKSCKDSGEFLQFFQPASSNINTLHSYSAFTETKKLILILVSKLQTLFRFYQFSINVLCLF